MKSLWRLIDFVNSLVRTYLDLENFNFAATVYFCWHVDNNNNNNNNNNNFINKKKTRPCFLTYDQQHALPRPEPVVKNWLAFNVFI